MSPPLTAPSAFVSASNGSHVGNAASYASGSPNAKKNGSTSTSHIERLVDRIAVITFAFVKALVWPAQRSAVPGRSPGRPGASRTKAGDFVKLFLEIFMEFGSGMNYAMRESQSRCETMRTVSGVAPDRRWARAPFRVYGAQAATALGGAGSGHCLTSRARHNSVERRYYADNEPLR